MTSNKTNGDIMLTKAEAKKRGKTLMAWLKGTKFKLVLWENMGWHFCAEAPRITVYGDSHSEVDSCSYTCLAGGNHSGIPGWSPEGSNKNPVKLVMQAMVLADENAAIVMKTRDLILSCMGDK